jgi:hypothetical protein
MSAAFTRQVAIDANGRAIEQFAITVQDVRAPERRYSAESATVRYNGRDAVYFIFVQENLVGMPRSMITVKMYAEAVRAFVETLSPVREALASFRERTGMVVPKPVTPDTEPEQTIALTANVVQAAFSGFEAEMRLYHISPYSTHIASKSGLNRIPIEPVVQVDFPTAMFAALVEQLDEIMVTLPRGDK